MLIVHDCSHGQRASTYRACLESKRGTEEKNLRPAPRIAHIRMVTVNIGNSSTSCSESQMQLSPVSASLLRVLVILCYFLATVKRMYDRGAFLCAWKTGQTSHILAEASQLSHGLANFCSSRVCKYPHKYLKKGEHKAFWMKH